uniref:Uncharacterized protein n=1 Tax=Rhizophora mucronata TaxID=61149 RepID=A0A2P2ILH1_RHIMU
MHQVGFGLLMRNQPRKFLSFTNTIKIDRWVNQTSTKASRTLYCRYKSSTPKPPLKKNPDNLSQIARLEFSSKSTSTASDSFLFAIFNFH